LRGERGAKGPRKSKKKGKKRERGERGKEEENMLTDEMIKNERDYRGGTNSVIIPVGGGYKKKKIYKSKEHMSGGGKGPN